jgi:hypothetical protein
MRILRGGGSVTFLAVWLASAGCGQVVPLGGNDAQLPSTLPNEEDGAALAPAVDGGTSDVEDEVAAPTRGPALDAGVEALVAASVDAAAEVAPTVDAAAEVAPTVDAAVEVAPTTDAVVEVAPTVDAGAADVVEAPPARTCAVKINEVQTGGQTALDEFVELYNTCPDRDVSLAGFKLVYRSDAGNSDVLRVAFGAQVIAAGKPYFVCANDAFAGDADVRYSDGLKAEGGALALRGPDGKVVDAVGWGTATNDFVEGTAAPAPLPGQSIAREPDGADTNDNAKDFVLRTVTTSPGANNSAK